MEVFYWRCENGNKECNIYYDGSKDGIFNFTGNILVSYTIFMDFLSTLVSAKAISFTGYITKLEFLYNYMYGRGGSQESNTQPGFCKFMSKTQWIECFFSWTELLDIGNNLPFECIICKKYPAWLCFDGVSLGCPKKFIQWNSIDHIINVNAEFKSPSKHNPNNPLIANDLCRVLLKDFINGKLNDKEWISLLLSLKEFCPILGLFLEELYQKQLAVFGNKKFFTYSFSGIWQNILKVCCGKSGVAFFMHPAIICVTFSFLKNGGVTIEQMYLLRALCPTLHEFITLQKKTKQPLTEKGKKVLELLANFCRQHCLEIFSEDGTQILGVRGEKQQDTQIPGGDSEQEESGNTRVSMVEGGPTTKQIINEINESLREDTASAGKKKIDLMLQNPIHLSQFAKVAMVTKKGWTSEDIGKITPIAEKDPVDSGSCWKYSWPKLREMKGYNGLDTPRNTPVPSQNRGPSNQWADPNTTNDDECQKTESSGYSSKDLIAGLFVGCCVHRICYGFHLMVEPEGRKDLMKVLYERMPEPVLNSLTILFDFSCQAGVYCVRREPIMFAQTKFLIDRFHSLSHKCADHWKLKNYPSFFYMQSTASESLNSNLQPFQSMCAYMKQGTFIKFLSLYIGVRNWLKNKKLVNALSRNEQNKDNM